MLTPQQDGSLLLSAPLYEKAPYDVSNNTVLAQCDGCGAISRYAVAGLCNVLVPDSFYAGYQFNDQAIAATHPKTVQMLGRMQHMTLTHEAATVTCATFLDEQTQAIFQAYTVRNDSATPTTFSVNFGFLVNAAALAQATKTVRYAALQQTAHTWGDYYGAADGVGVQLATSEPLVLREIQDVGVHATLRITVPSRSEGRLTLALALALQQPLSDILGGIDAAYQEAVSYAAWLSEVGVGDCMQKAMHCASLNCGISSYKELGDFAGFFAGVNYQSPARTYYRDSFFTALPVLAHRPQWVAKQLLTLAGGIGKDGRCPSAVCEKGGFFWADHLDAPQYFTILLSRYVAATGDVALLQARVGDKTMLEHAVFISDTLLASADEQGLLYRAAGNRHDWADNVYREGYVTYVEALFCHAVAETGVLLQLVNDSRHTHYTAAASHIADAIERLLWLEDKGWYCNYRSETCSEEHLSIDTVLLAWFGVCKPERARRMLENMETWLESHHNTAQPFGDWGTLCCWPPYHVKAHLVEKSSYDFVYHNGSDWPFWSCVLAIAKIQYGLDGTYPALRWFTYGLAQGWGTPVEYYNPITGKGSYLQGWSAMGALASCALAAGIDK